MEELKRDNTDELITDDTDTEKEVSNGWLVQVYKHFDNVPVKVIDAFIVICVIALIAVVAVGTLKAKHII